MTEQNTQNPTLDQIKILQSDWLTALGRDGRYVHRNVSGAMKHTVQGEDYSEHLTGELKELDTVERIRRSRRLAENIINMMVSERVKINVGSTESFSQPGFINIATDYFDKPDCELSAGKKADIMAGLAVHEAAHLVHSDFEKLENLTDDDGLAELRKEIWNILEDERIEWLVGDEMPGMADYLAATKDWYFNNKGGTQMANNPPAKEERLSRIIQALTLAVRFPKSMDEMTIRDYWQELSELREAITPFPRSTEAVHATTERVMDVIKKLIKQDLKEKKEQEQKQKNGNGQQQQTEQQSQSQSPSPSSSPSVNNNGNSNGQPDGKDKKDNKDTSNSSGNGNQKSEQKNNGTTNIRITEKGIINEIKRQMVSESGQKAINRCRQASSQNGVPDKSDSLDEKTTSYANDNAEREKIPGNGAGGGTITYLEKAKTNPENYNDSLKKVKKYIPAMRRVLTCRTTETDYELRGLPSGKLNTNKLVSLRAGNTNIFDKQGTVTTDGAAVCLLIDESGSMSSNDKFIAARDAAVLIEQTLKTLPKIHFFAYGFRGHSPISIYAEDGRGNACSLGSIGHKGGTPTADAMLVAGKRVRKHYGGKCLMLILTDGEPNANQDVPKADAMLRKQNFVPIGIGIDNECWQIKSIMKDAIIMTDIASLPLFLGKLTKKHLNEIIVNEEY